MYNSVQTQTYIPPLKAPTFGIYAQIQKHFCFILFFQRDNSAYIYYISNKNKAAMFSQSRLNFIGTKSLSCSL